jgi:hypothetical protein
MLLNGAISEPEPQARTLVSLGGVKRLKNVRQIFGADAVACVSDGHTYSGTAVS